MFKTVGLLKRRPGMSVEDFRSYYESNHRVIGEKYLTGNAVRYVRRFLDPAPNSRVPADVERGGFARQQHGRAQRDDGEGSGDGVGHLSRFMRSASSLCAVPSTST